MKLKKPPRYHNPRLDLLDSLMDSYVHWRDESRAVTESYRTWHSAPGGEREAAFNAYLAALDREEHAAGGYRRVIEQAHGT